MGRRPGKRWHITFNFTFSALITICKLLPKDLKGFKPTIFFDMINYIYANSTGKFITVFL